MSVTYVYHAEILEQLAAHGLRPRPATHPQRAYDFVSDLYRFELRRLRDRLLGRAIPKAEYSQHVVELRKRYILLSIPLRRWVEGDDRSPGPGDKGCGPIVRR